MLMEQTLEKMNAMKLSAMVEAIEQQRRSNQYTDLSFEERLGLLVDEEWTAREHRKLTRRLRAAKLRYPTASLENVDFKHRRSLDRSQVRALGSCGWIQDRTISSSPVRPASERASGFGFRRTRLPAGLQTPPTSACPALAPNGGRPWRRLLHPTPGPAGQADLLAIDDWLLAPLRDAETPGPDRSRRGT